MAAKLAGLGFAADDVADALAVAAAAGAANGQALEACLDWLCMHVPEVDLPPAFGPGAVRSLRAFSTPSDDGHAWGGLPTSAFLRP